MEFMIKLYPKIINIEKDKATLTLLAGLSAMVIAICIITNYIVSKRLNWSIFAGLGIIYTWITVLYSIKKNTNIASNVMVQLIILSLVTFGIDYTLGFEKWSIEIAIPIIIIVANITIFILTIVSYKQYIKYFIYQIVIFILSMIPIATYFIRTVDYGILAIIAASTAIVTMLFTIIICGRDVKEELAKRFHI